MLTNSAMNPEQAAALQAAYAAARREWQRVVWAALERYRAEREAAGWRQPSSRA